MKTIVCRVGYCKSCYDAGRPKTDNLYAVKGSSGWHVHIIEYAAPHTNPVGFVPHIFQLEKVVKEEVHYTKTCGMHSCGISISYDEDKNPQYGIHFKNQQKGIMTIANWNALILFKDTGYKIEP